MNEWCPTGITSKTVLRKKKKKKMVLGYFFQLAASCGQGAQVEVK
jgi:hypothetical protein